MKYLSFSFTLISCCLLAVLLTGQPRTVSAESITAPLAEPAGQDREAPADPAANQLVKPLQQNPAMAAPQSAVDSAAAELHDIKAPVEIANNSRKMILTAAAVLTGLLLSTLFLFWWKRSRRQQAVTAHETALLQLEQADQLIKEERVNAFITLIDQTLRRYIEQRFAISARQQTTREFITRLTTDKEPVPQPLTDNSENLKTWLEHCDLVKFARAGLSRESMTAMVTNLRSFIESTKIETGQTGQEEAKR
jgi:hypothetical protein